MRLFLCFSWIALGLVACDEPPSSPRDANTTINGLVVVTAPVTGAVVSAYRVDAKSGVLGDLVATSDPTSEDGSFHIELGSAKGFILLVAKGVGATYIEPAAGSVQWDSSVALRAFPVERLPSQELDFELGYDAKVESLVISPWSELAVAYADARLRHQYSKTYSEALGRSFSLFFDHLELAFWETLPASLTGPAVGGWNTQVQAGLELAGLSQWVRRAANDSNFSASALTTLQALRQLTDDLGDAKAQFDGNGARGPLTLGTCTSVCALSSKTARAHYAEAMATFLGSLANTSGIDVTDAGELLRRISSRRSELWADDGSQDFDTTAPLIDVDLQEASILTGVRDVVVTVTDNLKMGTVEVDLLRQGESVRNGNVLKTTLMPSGERVLVANVKLDSTVLSDGPVTLHIEAKDAAGNLATPIERPAFFDNAPAATLTGAVVLGGPVVGARIRVYEHENAVQGALLGSAITDETGLYQVADIMDTTKSSVLVVAENARGRESTYYIEGTNGTKIVLGVDDRFETLLTGWRNGVDRTDGVITPWTHIVAAYARAIYAYLGGTWPTAVDGAFDAFQLHFAEGGNGIDLRSVVPANLTIKDAGASLNVQVRYGLMLAALGQLADRLATQAGATSASVNTLTLTQQLAADLGDEPGAPILNGRGIGPLLVSGTVPLSSYTTRVELAVAAAAFLRTNPANGTQFREQDVAPLLDRISTDDGHRGVGWPTLYPATESPKPYDTMPPGPVLFLDPSPADGAIVRGALELWAEANDTRALSGFQWLEPKGKFTGILLDQGAGRAGPWILSGNLNTSLLPEGGLTIVARAYDEAGLFTDVSKMCVIDRTPPTITIKPGTTSSGTVASGEWTAAADILVGGTVTDLHPASSSYVWRGGAPEELVLDGTAWSLGLTLAEGANSLAVSSLDQAGNPATDSSTYYRDSIQPVVTITQAKIGATLLPADGWTNSTDLITVQGTIDEANLETSTVSWNGTSQSLTVAGTGTWTVDLESQEGNNTITVEAKDRAKSTHLASDTYHRDTLKPVVTIGDADGGFGIVPQGGWTQARAITITGTVTEANLASATYTWNGVSGSLSLVDGTWRLDLETLEGANTLVVAATDLAKNPHSATSTYYRDTVKPVLAITQGIAGGDVVPPDGWTNQKSITFSGTIEELNLFEVVYAWNLTGTLFSGQPLAVPSPPNWQVTVSLIEGENRLAIRGEDKAGNFGRASVKVYRDGAVPVITIDKATATTAAGSVVVAPGAWSAASAFAINGTLVEPNLVSITYRWNAGAATMLPITDGKWSLSGLAAVDGPNTLSISATDKAKNSVTQSATYNVDLVKPTVTGVENKIDDEGTVIASVSGNGVGAVSYGLTRDRVTLTATGQPTITKYASRYATSTDPTTNNLPAWWFNVSDDRSVAADVTLKARLSRAKSPTPLTEWFVVPTVAESGYNRQLVLSSALHADVALVSDTYTFEYEAKDEVGNTQAGAFSWIHKLRPPPVRQRAASGCKTSDSQCPGYYGLEKNNAAVALYGGSGLGPDNKLRIGEGFIDNPNDVPVRVTVVETATRTYAWRTNLFAALVGSSTASATTKWPTGCDTGISDRLAIGGDCFPRDTSTDFGNGSNIDTTSSPKVLIGTSVLSPCAGCAVDEVEIPPKTTVEVRIQVKPFSYLGIDFLVDDGTDAQDYLRPPVTGVLSSWPPNWLRCTKTEVVSSVTKCTAWNTYQDYHILYSGEATYTLKVGLFARPAAASETAVTATGTSATNFSYTANSWSTIEDAPSELTNRLY